MNLAACFGVLLCFLVQIGTGSKLSPVEELQKDLIAVGMDYGIDPEKNKLLEMLAEEEEEIPTNIQEEEKDSESIPHIEGIEKKDDGSLYYNNEKVKRITEVSDDEMDKEVVYANPSEVDETSVYANPSEVDETSEYANPSEVDETSVYA